MPDDVNMQYSGRQPLLNAPWTVITLVIALVMTHAARVVLGIDADRLALTAQDLASWNWPPLFTHMFVHASWAHVLMNAAFSLAFGAPVARCLGVGWRGAATFFGFFLLCGVIASLSYGGVQSLLGAAAGGAWALVGASGAASGLMGAAARLIQGRGRVGPIAGRVVVAMTIAWIVINAVLGLSGLTPGAGGAPVAWQAHIFGFLAGLLLIAPAAWIARGQSADHEQSP